MQKSESIKNLAEALTKFQNEVPAIARDGKNPFFKSDYATLGNIIDTIRNPMVKNGLSFSQFPSGENGLETILMHKSGEWISDSFVIKPVDQKPQSLGSAITYGRRYALSALLGLNTDADDDGNAASRVPVSYDTSEVPDDAVPTVTYDQETHQKPWNKAKNMGTQKPPTALQKKKMIMDLVDRIVIEPLERTAEAYRTYVHGQTGLPLEPGNYDEILLRLNELANPSHD